MCKKSNRRRNKTIIVDGTAVTLDLNSFRRKFQKKDLVKKDYRWGFSNTHGYYLGFKLSLVIEYPLLRPLCVLIHPGSTNDSKLFLEILEELKRRKIILNGDNLIFDKGYFSSRNYQLGILPYKIVPIIFPRSNFKVEKAYSKICYPLSVFSRHDGKKVMKEFDILFARLKTEMLRWTTYISVRSIIENVFKLAKNAIFLKRLHRYSRPSVTKFVCMNVLLAGMLIMSGFNSKKQLQAIAEW